MFFLDKVGILNAFNAKSQKCSEVKKSFIRLCRHWCCVQYLPYVKFIMHGIVWFANISSFMNSNMPCCRRDWKFTCMWMQQMCKGKPHWRCYSAWSGRRCRVVDQNDSWPRLSQINSVRCVPLITAAHLKQRADDHASDLRAVKGDRNTHVDPSTCSDMHSLCMNPLTVTRNAIKI